MISLPDVNVLLALAWSNHPQHVAATNWFRQSSSSGWATCLLTQSAFLRLSLNPAAVRAKIDSATAHQLLAKMVGHSQHRFLAYVPGITQPVFDDLLANIYGHNQVTDAVLLYVAKVHGAKLVTFDQAAAQLCPWPSVVEQLVAS